MADKTPAAPGGGVPGQAFYDREVAELKAMIKEKATIEASLAQIEAQIHAKESEYLETTPYGNIIVGFDGYTKGTAAGGGRRTKTITESNRIFSNSSVSYKKQSTNENTPEASAVSTPAASGPTPSSASFPKDKDGGSNHATPTSTTSGKGGSHKRPKKTGDVDSDGEKDPKKARTGSVISRK